jgi:hypothetical protein
VFTGDNDEEEEDFASWKRRIFDGSSHDIAAAHDGGVRVESGRGCVLEADDLDLGSGQEDVAMQYCSTVQYTVRKYGAESKSSRRRLQGCVVHRACLCVAAEGSC